MLSGEFSPYGRLKSGKEFGTNGSLYNSTAAFGIGETIGFQLDFSHDQGTLSLFKNGVR